MINDANELFIINMKAVVVEQRLTPSFSAAGSAFVLHSNNNAQFHLAHIRSVVQTTIIIKPRWSPFLPGVSR